MSKQLFVLVTLGLSMPLRSEEPSPGNALQRSERFQIGTGAPQSIVQKGERLQIQTVAPLMDNPPEVTVVDFGPRGWVLVTYDKKFLKLQTDKNPEQEVAERYQVWVNFDHVIAAKKIPVDRK